MRLYLSSFRLGNQPAKLVELVGLNKRVAVIANAKDTSSDEQRRADRVQSEIGSLKDLGLMGVEIDLRRYFGKSDELRVELVQYGAVWILGGNVFALRQAMHESGFDVLIKDLLQKDAIVYAGYSAAGCILSSTLKGFDLVDPVSNVMEISKKQIIWDGLNLLPYSFIPHYKSDHPESEAVDKVVEFMLKEQLPFKTLRDGEVLWINGDQEETLK